MAEFNLFEDIKASLEAAISDADGKGSQLESGQVRVPAVALSTSTEGIPPKIACPFKFKTMFLMRGLPGSGKSSIAQSLVGANCTFSENDGYRFIQGPHGVICTTDAYFYTEWSEDGEYVFNPKLLGDNHAKNQRAASLAMSLGVPAVVIDNTHTKAWETKAYVDLAKQRGYKIVVVEVPHVDVETCVENNSHDVPSETIGRMDRDWECFRVPGSFGDEL